MKKKSLIYLISNIATASLPFLLLPILTRFLSVNEYGKLAMFQVVMAGFVSIIGCGIVKASSRKFFDKTVSSQLSIYNTTALVVPITISTFLALVLYMLNFDYDNYFGISKQWILLALLISNFQIISQFILTQWQVRGKAISYGLYQFVTSSINITISIILVLYVYGNADGRIYGILITTIMSSVFSLIYLLKSKLIVLEFSKKMLKEILAFGIPLVPHLIGLYLITFSDRYVIQNLLGIDKTGIYLAAFQLSMIYQVIFSSVDKAYVPWLFNKLNEDFDKSTMVLYLYKIMVGIVIMGILAFSLSPFFVDYVLGESYLEVKSFIGWLFLGQMFFGLYMVVNSFIFYEKKTSWISSLTILMGLIQILLMVFFISSYGLVGAAISFCATRCIQFIGTWYLAQKSHRMPWFNFRGSGILSGDEQ